MQFLLQALFAETAAEGKKPDAPISTGDSGGAEKFAELLLPEKDAEVEITPEPLVIDAVALPLTRHSRVVDPVVGTLISDQEFVAVAWTEVSKWTDVPAVLSALPGLATLATAEPILSEPKPNVAPRFAVTVPEKLVAGASATNVAPEEPQELAKQGSVKSVLTEPKPALSSAGLTVKSDRVFPVQENGAKPLVAHSDTTAEPQNQSETREEVLAVIIDGPETSLVPPKVALPLENLVRKVKSPVVESVQAVPVLDQPRSETPQVTGPMVAPVEGQFPREIQVRRDHRETRVADRQNTGRDASVATPAAPATPTIVVAPIAQLHVPLDQRMFEDAGHPTIDATTGFSPRESEEVRPQTSTPSRVEAAARPVMTQIIHTIIRSNLEGMIEVRLSPEELGRVKLAMSQADVGITVHITAERPETLDLIRRNIDMLEANLRDQGFQDLSFSFGQDGTKDRAEDEAVPDRDGATSAVSQVEVALMLTPTQDGRLDIRL